MTPLVKKNNQKRSFGRTLNNTLVVMLYPKPHEAGPCSYHPVYKVYLNSGLSPMIFFTSISFAILPPEIQSHGANCDDYTGTSTG